MQFCQRFLIENLKTCQPLLGMPVARSFSARTVSVACHSKPPWLQHYASHSAKAVAEALLAPCRLRCWHSRRQPCAHPPGRRSAGPRRRREAARRRRGYRGASGPSRTLAGSTPRSSRRQSLPSRCRRLARPRPRQGCQHMRERIDRARCTGGTECRARREPGYWTTRMRYTCAGHRR